jgi:hypothetical protein
MRTSRNAILKARAAELEAQLAKFRECFGDPAPCARCKKLFEAYELVAEEGDEWECFVCNDRENARERFEHAAAPKA